MTVKRSGVEMGSRSDDQTTATPFQLLNSTAYLIAPNLTDESSATEMNATEPLQTPEEYEESKIRWIIICSIVLGIAFGFATFLHIRKATNWEQRSKIRKMIKMRKLDFVESRKIRRVKTVWQKPDEFLKNYDSNVTAPGSKHLRYEHENLRRRPLVGTFNYTGLKAFELSEKNYIKECLPYDQNRIKLPLDPSIPCSDYINGSFVDGYNKPEFYLTIQGPFESSILDFWRVVWLHKVRCIVMLCEPFEFAARHCFRYWPENKSMSYGDIDVQVESVHKTIDYITRTFIVSHAASNEKLQVKHFQYKNWPQFGQPDVYTFLQLVYTIRANNLDLRPVVVHSKTGSCRTGLYISIDYCIDTICIDNIVNIHECVRRIRRCRPGLVQTIEQYTFIYSAIRVFLLCGLTEVPLKHLTKFVDIMGEAMNGLSTTGFEQQYHVLNKLRVHLTQNDSASGIMSENRWVSRDATCLPPDEYRAHLITGRKGCHDYINAVICNSYLRANTFIVTQWPLLTTVKDFWRMIYDYGIVSTIVLSDVSTGLRYPKFWPVKRGKRQLFDVISVNLETKEKKVWGTEYAYTMRQWEGHVDMKSVLMKAGESAAAVPKGEGRTTGKWVSKLYLVNGWRPSQPEAKRVESIFEVLLEIEKNQKECGPEKFICVVSSDGVQQCGVFMTLFMAHQQMVNEGKVDIMTNALAIRRTRPRLLPTKEEYEYCWRLAAKLNQTEQESDPDTAFGSNCALLKSAFSEVHKTPVPVLCTRCWYCQNKARIVALSELEKRQQQMQKKASQNEDMAISRQDLNGQLLEEDMIMSPSPQPLVYGPRSPVSVMSMVQSAHSAFAKPTGLVHNDSTDIAQPLLAHQPLTIQVDSPRRRAPMLAVANQQPAFSQRSEDDILIEGP